MNIIKKYFFYKKLRKLYRSLGTFKIESNLECGKCANADTCVCDVTKQTFKKYIRYKIYEISVMLRNVHWKHVKTDMKIFNYCFAKNIIFNIKLKRARQINRCRAETIIPPKNERY
ncbi:MAG: hypothetical protein ACOC2U_00570 [bacterium]